jgi:hypothetical protein
LLDQEGLDVDGSGEMLISRQREEVEDDGGSSSSFDEEYFRGTASIDGSGNPINKTSPSLILEGVRKPELFGVS